jgi:CRP-like cAMP-binding protein
MPSIDDHASWASTLDYALGQTENAHLGIAGVDDSPEENPLDQLDGLRNELDEIECEASEVVWEQGNLSDAMFIIEEALMTAFGIDARGTRHRLPRFGKGATVGEIGLITGGQRSAQVVAETRVCAPWLSIER